MNEKTSIFSDIKPTNARKAPMARRLKWIPLISVIARFNVLFLCMVLIGTALSSPVLAATGSVTYTYDALGRVTTAAYDTGVIIIYNYDANGNRTQQIINVNTGTLVWTATGGSCSSNCWGGSLW